MNARLAGTSGDCSVPQETDGHQSLIGTATHRQKVATSRQADANSPELMRFLTWLAVAGIGGRITWPALAWEYHQYLHDTGDDALSATQLQRQLRPLRVEKMIRVKSSELAQLRRLWRLLHVQGWPVTGSDKSLRPSVRVYDLPPVRHC